MMLKLKAKQIRKNIFHVVFPNQHLMSSTMFRLQEFYESPIKKVQGHVLSLDRMIDLYAEKYGRFTYFEDWNGFNVPDYTIKEFFDRYSRILTEKEYLLERAIQKIILESDEKTYLIATWDPRHLSHEIAHGFFHIYPEYKTMMSEMVHSYEYKNILFKKLRKLGYLQKVLIDEVQAYMATSIPSSILNTLELPTSWKYTPDFKNAFQRFDKHNNTK